MGINANYKDDKYRISDAYIRIERIWGGKQDNQWNAWVGVYHHKDSARSNIPLFQVSAPYTTENANPYEVLYTIIEKLPQLNDAKLIKKEMPVEIPTVYEPINEPIIEPVAEVIKDIPKKIKKKTNKSTE